MRDVVDALAAYAPGEQLEQLLNDLSRCESTRSNKLFAEFVRRLRRSAGLSPDLAPPGGKGPLLELMEEKETDNVPHVG
jgi:hypothetical protein